MGEGVSPSLPRYGFGFSDSLSVSVSVYVSSYGGINFPSFERADDGVLNPSGSRNKASTGAGIPNNTSTADVIAESKIDGASLADVGALHTAGHSNA